MNPTCISSPEFSRIPDPYGTFPISPPSPTVLFPSKSHLQVPYYYFLIYWPFCWYLASKLQCNSTLESLIISYIFTDKIALFALFCWAMFFFYCFYGYHIHVKTFLMIHFCFVLLQSNEAFSPWLPLKADVFAFHFPEWETTLPAFLQDHFTTSQYISFLFLMFLQTISSKLICLPVKDTKGLKIATTKTVIKNGEQVWIAFYVTGCSFKYFSRINSFNPPHNLNEIAITIPIPGTWWHAFFKGNSYDLWNLYLTTFSTPSTLQSSKRQSISPDNCRKLSWPMWWRKFIE